MREVRLPDRTGVLKPLWVYESMIIYGRVKWTDFEFGEKIDQLIFIAEEINLLGMDAAWGGFILICLGKREIMRMARNCFLNVVVRENFDYDGSSPGVVVLIKTAGVRWEQSSSGRSQSGRGAGRRLSIRWPRPWEVHTMNKFGDSWVIWLYIPHIKFWGNKILGFSKFSLSH